MAEDNEHLSAMYGDDGKVTQNKQKIFTSASGSYVTIMVDGKPIRVPSIEYVASLEKQLKDMSDEMTKMAAKIKNLTIKSNNAAISVSSIRKDVRTLAKPVTPKDNFS